METSNGGSNNEHQRQHFSHYLDAINQHYSSWSNNDNDSRNNRGWSIAARFNAGIRAILARVGYHRSGTGSARYSNQVERKADKVGSNNFAAAKSLKVTKTNGDISRVSSQRNRDTKDG